MNKRIFAAAIILLSTSLWGQAKPATTPSSSAPAASSAPSGSLTEQTINEFLRHTFGYDQNLKWKVLEIKPAADPSLNEVTVMMSTPQGQQVLKLFVTPDQRHAINGEFVPFGTDPYLDARQILQKKTNGPARGPADAPLTIVEFGDLQCPVCKRAQPVIERLLKDVPNARLIFQQFPLVQIHRWAMAAAKYGNSVSNQNNDAYWKFVDVVYGHQDEMQQLTEDKVLPLLKQYAGESGVNADQAEQCTNDAKTSLAINDSLELGRELDVTGTPTLFVGGRKIGNVNGMQYETLKAIAEFQAQNK